MKFQRILPMLFWTLATMGQSSVSFSSGAPTQDLFSFGKGDTIRLTGNTRSLLTGRPQGPLAFEPNQGVILISTSRGPLPAGSDFWQEVYRPGGVCKVVAKGRPPGRNDLPRVELSFARDLTIRSALHKTEVVQQGQPGCSTLGMNPCNWTTELYTSSFLVDDSKGEIDAVGCFAVLVSTEAWTQDTFNKKTWYGFEVLRGSSGAPTSFVPAALATGSASAPSASPVRSNNATASSIDAAFEAMIAKAKSGDRVEILLTAHGSDTCEELGPHIRTDTGSQCKHTFTVFDDQGREVQYPSEKMLRYLKRLEDKGALPSVVFNSCHSGRVKAQFKNMGLTNTCAFFQTAGNELGYGCFEDDPDFAKDYTSTGEYVAMRYYQSNLSTLVKDPYFSQSACFQKTSQHYRENNMRLDSISSAYWNARRKDATFQSPALSTLLNFPYFTTGQIQPQITRAQDFSCDCMTMSPNNSLIKQLTELGAQITDAATAPYNQALNEYNEAVKALRAELERKLPETPERLARVSELQQQVKAKAENFMSKERGLIDQFFKDQNVTPDPCARSL